MLFGLLPVLAQLAPALASKFFGASGEAIAAKAAEIAKAVSGVDDAKAALEKIQAEGALTLQFQQALMPLQIAELEADTKRLTEINATIRAEIASDDAFVRRMRPTFGYVLSFGIGLVFVTLSGVAVFNPDRIAAVAEAMAEATGWVEVALAVLGVYVYRRSGEKNAKAGAPPMLDGAARLVSAIRSK